MHPLCEWAAERQWLTEGDGLVRKTKAAGGGTRGRADSAHDEGERAIY